MDRFAPILRGIAEKVGLKSVKDLIKQPGIKVVYRVTMHYQDFRASDSVATLTHSISVDIPLEVYFPNHFNNKPIVCKLPPKAYDEFVGDFNKLKFDKLTDQHNTSPYGKDLCMVERGSGSFVHSVIFAPIDAKEDYAKLYTAIKTFLPEALREVQ